MSQSGSDQTGHLIEEEESYFVSMTDMMVGIIFVFVILLMTFALSYREAEQVRQDKVEQLTAADAAKQSILENLKRTLEDAGVKVEIDLENGVLHLPEEILFPSGSASLNERGQQALGHLARALGLVIPCYTAESSLLTTAKCRKDVAAKLDAIFIEGHTDNVPVGAQSPFKDNWELSVQRAITTYNHLITIEPELNNLNVAPPDLSERDDNVQHEQKVFSVSGYGEHRPREDNSTDAGRQANRRIDLRFLMRTPRSRDLEIVEDRISTESRPSAP